MNTVVHYKAGPFAPLTENWLPGQMIRHRCYRPVVYCHSRENPDLFGDLKVRSLHLKGRRRPWAFLNRRLYELFDHFPAMRLFLTLDRPVLVHAHFGPSGYMILPLTEMASIPLITSFYGYDVSMLPLRWPQCRELYRQLFERGRLFLAEGPFMASRLVEMGCPPERTMVHRLGIDLEAIHWEPRCPGDDGEVRVLVAASFREKKGIPLAIRAFSAVKKRNPRLKMRLTVIGDSLGYPEMEEEKHRILESVRSSGCLESIEMKGYRGRGDFMKELYRHHLFMSPSLTAKDGDAEGGAPVAIIEASASGMPVLSTLHCDIPQVVLHGHSGLLSEEGDLESLASNLEELVLNPERWEEMGREGRARVEECFDVVRQAETLEKIYDDLLADSDGARCLMGNTGRKLSQTPFNR